MEGISLSISIFNFFIFNISSPSSIRHIIRKMCIRDRLIDEMKEKKGVTQDVDLTAEDLKELAMQFKACLLYTSRCV